MSSPWRLVAAVAAVVLSAGAPVEGPPAAPPSEAVLAASVSVFSVSGSVDGLTSRSTRAGTSVLTVGTDALFAFGGDRLDPVAVAALARQLANMPRRGTVSVIGNTDAVGSAAANMRLSLRRARAVAAVVRRERPGARVSAAGHGEWVPVASSSDPDGRAANRRVSISWSG